MRRAFANSKESVAEYIPSLGCTLGEALLRPTKIYVKPVLAAANEVKIKGCAHITGGGFYENIPRAVKEGLCASIREMDVKTPPVFSLLEERGNIPRRDMFNTFNMGVGMCLIVAAEDAEKCVDILRANGEEAYILGELKKGEGVEIC